MEGLQPTLKTFIRFEAVKIVSFLTTVTSSLRPLHKSKGAAVAGLAYIISGNLKVAYHAHVNRETATSPLKWTGPYLLHALLARFLTEGVLHATHHAVSLTEHGVKRDEIQFTKRMLDDPLDCSNVWKPAEVFKALVRGLAEATRVRTLHHMRHLSLAERLDITMLCKISL